MSNKIPRSWDEHVRRIANMTPAQTKESAAQKRARLDQLKVDYNAYVRYYFPSEVDCDCADYHLEIAYNLRDNEKINLLNVIYRGGAKSTHVNMMVPIWLIFFYDAIDFMILVSDTGDLAKNLLRAIQIQFENNQRIIQDFGKQISNGDWEDGEFTISKGTSFKAIGLNQQPRGLKDMFNRRPDYISVDDVDDRKKANNQVLTAERVSRILGALKQSFQKDKQRFVFSNNLIHKQGITAHLIEKLRKSKRTHIIWRNAVVERPKKQSLLEDLVKDTKTKVSYGKDNLGLPAWKERYSLDYWKELRADTVSAEFAREYENDPVEEGVLFKKDWIHFKAMGNLGQYDEILAYGDLSYRATGDYKAFVVIGRTKTTTGTEFHILNVFLKKTTLQTVVDWCYDYQKALPESIAITFYVEANFIQDTFVDAFYQEGNIRGYHIYVKGDKRQKPDKYQRIEQMTSFFERGMVFWNEALKNQRDMSLFIDQVLQFEKGVAHDDAPDCLEGGIHLLNKANKASSFTVRIGKLIKNPFRQF